MSSLVILVASVLRYHAKKNSHLPARLPSVLVKIIDLCLSPFASPFYVTFGYEFLSISVNIFRELFKADDPGEEIRHCASRKLLYHDVVDFGNVCGPPGGENAAAWHICHVPDLTRESSTRRGAPAKLTPYQQSICIFNLHVYRAVPGELCITALTASCVLWFIPCAFCRYSRLRFSR